MLKNKINNVNKIISILEEWKNDISITENETAYSDDVLRHAKKIFDNLVMEDR